MAGHWPRARTYMCDRFLGKGVETVDPTLTFLVTSH